MRILTMRILSGIFLFLCFGLTISADEVIYNVSTPANKIVSLAGAKFTQTAEGLLIETQGAQSQKKPEVYPGIAVKGNWDLKDYNAVEIEIIHRDTKGRLPLSIRFSDKELAGEANAFIIHSEVMKKGTVVKTELLQRRKFRTSGLRRAPWDGNGLVDNLKSSKITSVGVYMPKPLLDWKWGIKKITLKKVDFQNANEKPEIAFFKMPTVADYLAYFDANPVWVTMTPEQFFPFVDIYGQFKYKEWPGKIHSDAELIQAKEAEAKDLTSHPGPEGWNKYGGWTAGPKFKATGNFRVEKIEGKWWIIDPDGYLYWSHGPDRVTSSSGETPLDGRKHYFTDLPKEDSPLGQFYHTHDALLRPYYTVRNIKETYDFSSANVFRKYGGDWKKTYGEMAHKRLRSWGMNTVANSSDSAVCLMNKTPYTDRIELKSPAIQGCDGHYWWPFRDPFDPEFRANFRRQLLERQDEINNVWCLGFFVDNELNWGHETSLAQWTLQSPASQCAKIEFVKRLKEKYSTVEKLNSAWNGTYKSWEDLLQNTVTPPQGSKADCADFSAAIVEEYYRSVRDEFKKVAPNKLYLGARFAGSCYEKFLRIGAKYSDVLSFNIYHSTVDKFTLPEGIDKPILVGEFHFGALDRGMFHWTLCGVKDQKERAQNYYNYVESAVKHPNFVGVHWHQYGEQSLTGRFDGENFQNGFLDVCDTPYPELIEKTREIGYKMYQIRSGK